jgi:SAM-dependent methyltransferase
VIDASVDANVLDRPTIVCPCCGNSSLEEFEDALHVEGHEIRIHICIVCCALVNQWELEQALSTTETEHEIQMTSPGPESYSDLEQHVKMYQQTLRFLLKALPSVNPAQSTFAQIGVGQGAAVRAAADLFKKCYAIDHDFSMFEAARSHLEMPDEVLCVNSIEHLFDPVDIVACWRSFERMPRLYDVIVQIRSALRPGGYLCFKAPLYRPNHLFKGIYTFFNYQTVTVLASLHGFDVVDISTDYSNALLQAILRKPNPNTSSEDTDLSYIQRKNCDDAAGATPTFWRPIGGTETDLQMRRIIGRKYVSGHGFEIGAGLVPTYFHGIEHLSVVDKLDGPEFERLFGETPPYDILTLEQARSGNPEGVDFVMAHQVLEHCSNPIKVLATEWISLLRDGGVLFISIPSYNMVSERLRLPTPLDHILDDWALDRSDEAYESIDHIPSFIIGWTEAHEGSFWFAKGSASEYARGILTEINRRGHDLHWHTYSFDVAAAMMEVGFYAAGVNMEWLHKQETLDCIYLVAKKIPAMDRPVEPQALREYKKRVDKILETIANKDSPSLVSNSHISDDER